MSLSEIQNMDWDTLHMINEEPSSNDALDGIFPELKSNPYLRDLKKLEDLLRCVTSEIAEVKVPTVTESDISQYKNAGFHILSREDSYRSKVLNTRHALLKKSVTALTALCETRRALDEYLHLSVLQKMSEIEYKNKKAIDSVATELHLRDRATKARQAMLRKSAQPGYQLLIRKYRDSIRTNESS